MSMGGALRAARLALVATLAVLATPSLARAQDVICDPGELEVRDLEFRGNQAVDEDDLEVVVATTASDFFRRSLRVVGARRCLDRQALPRDVLSLIGYYRERGYYQARVDTLVEPLGSQAVRVVFTIAEGPPTRVRSYTVDGLAGVPDSARLVNSRRLRVGAPFDYGLLQADLDTIRQQLRDAGYYHVDVLAPSYDRDSLVADIALTVIPGRPVVFGEPVVSVTPLEGYGQQLATPVARRVLGIAPGTPYSDRAVIAGQRSLFQLGTYRHIGVSFPDSLQRSPDTLVMLVELAETYMHQLDSEFGWASLDCGRVRLLYFDRNWLGTARRLDLTAQASKIGYGRPLRTTETRKFCELYGRSPIREDSVFSDKMHYHLGASVRQPRLLGTEWVPTVSLYSERRGEYRAFLRTTYAGLDLSGVRDIRDRTPVRVGYSVEYGYTQADPAALCALFNRCTPTEQADLVTGQTLGVLSGSITRVRTDNPLTPARGSVLRAELRTSATELLFTSPELFFNKATGDASVYFPLGWRNILALRLRTGIVEGLGGRRGIVPAQERLYAGGATSVRGFQQNELGDLVYIASPNPRLPFDTTVVAVAGADTTWRIQAVQNDSVPIAVERSVPLGGNTLVVANIDYRFRNPFFLTELLQYSVFVDVGEVWTRAADDRPFNFGQLKWTPGFGMRLITPIGPVQANVGYNDYARDQGPLYYNPNVNTLQCVTPGNTIDLRKIPGTNQFEQVDPDATCPPAFQPGRPSRFLQKLTFTFSIGAEF